MTKIMSLLLLLTALFLNREPDPSPKSIFPIAGYVVKQANQRSLIVNPVPRKVGSGEEAHELYEAFWVSDLPADVQLGQKIQVWADFILESYPAQIQATHYAILPSVKPEHADLTVEQAIRKALLEPAASSIRLFVILDLSYDAVSDRWTVSYKDGLALRGEESERELVIRD